MTKIVTKRLIVHGRVQGVYYRTWSTETATQLGLYGWVQNNADGTVEIIVTGTEDRIDHFIADCHEGPLAAQVKKVSVRDADDIDTKDLTSFSILQTA